MTDEFAATAKTLGFVTIIVEEDNSRETDGASAF
jgi:hypothetical protein